MKRSLYGFWQKNREFHAISFFTMFLNLPKLIGLSATIFPFTITEKVPYAAGFFVLDLVLIIL
jgi:hypothetical protein